MQNATSNTDAAKADQAKAPNTTPVPDATLDATEQQWIDRCLAQRRLIKGAVYEKAETEFFVGAMAALVSHDPSLQVPPRWVVAMMSGRRVIALDRFPKGGAA